MIIGDVLFETVRELDHYLNDPAFAYAGAIREDIMKLRDEAVYVAMVLDAPPGAPGLDKATVFAAIAEERRMAPRTH